MSLNVRLEPIKSKRLDKYCTNAKRTIEYPSVRLSINYIVSNNIEENKR